VARTLQGEYGARTTRVSPDDPESAVLFVAAPIRHQGAIIGVLTVAKPAASLTEFWVMAKKKITLAGLLATLVVILVGMVVSFWITWPIEKLTEYAHAVRQGQRVVLPELGRSELGELGRAFEHMRDALEGKQYVEHYVQALTHEMKSPLSAIRGAAELLQEEMPADQRGRFLENIRAESARMQEMIDRLLQLSAVEKRKGLNDVEPVSLPGLLAEVVESLEPVFSSKRVTVSVAPVNVSPVIHGERFLLRLALVNLLQNAFDFSPDGGEVSVSIEAVGSDRVVSVRDQGPGVPDYALPRVFDRFYSLVRPGNGKKSSGLGLTFVREVCMLHGGRVRLENQPGGGAVATLTLPVHPPDPR
jgi:two-component system sensor histidine kinase CreC